MIKKWFEIITDHRISLRERMFRIVTGICMIALIFTLPMGRNILHKSHPTVKEPIAYPA